MNKRHSKNMKENHNMNKLVRSKLSEHFSGGHYGTVAAHSQRFNLALDWFKKQYDITELRKITTEHLMGYAAYLKQLLADSQIAISTATNRVSSCNVALKIMRGDNRVRIDEIGKVLGEKRSYIRRKIPDGMCMDEVTVLQCQLIEIGHARLAAIVGLARACGMRLREAILADLPRLKREAANFKEINIQEGTKGGRRGKFAKRLIPVTDALRAAIDYALEVSPRSSRNLLSPSETYIAFLRKEVNRARTILKWHGIKGIHELRATYACSRYEQITGHPASIISKRKNLSPIDKDIDKKARKTISHELGHVRAEVTNAYTGSNTK
jgi:hypothetical protein